MKLLNHKPRSKCIAKKQRKKIKTTGEETMDQSANNPNGIEGLGDVCLLFQACRTSDEVYRITKDLFRRVFPTLSGGLSLISETRDVLETVVTWGEIEPKANHFDAAECWAMRRGRPHWVETHNAEDPVSCHHYDAASAGWHHCLPLMASGKTLGMIYICGPDADDVGDGGVAATFGYENSGLANVMESLSVAIANIRFQQTLQYQAIRDPLTGLFNRRYLDETLRREMDQAVRADEPLTFALLDVDHFKQFNDSFGHDAGDALLKAVGDVLTKQMRVGDIACRYGGEEFALVYPGMSEEVAARRLETIRTLIGKLSITHRGTLCKPATISAGLAVYPAQASDTESLINAADQALYKSKDTGRNCVSVAADLAQNSDDTPLRLVHGS